MQRRLIKFTIDIALWALCIPLAYLLRLDALTAILSESDSILWLTAASLPIQVFLLFAFRINRHAWHRISTHEVPRLGLMVLLWVAALFAIISSLKLSLDQSLLFPRSVPLIAGTLAILFFSGVRLSYRAYFEQRNRRSHGLEQKRTLIVGAGEAGVMLAKEMLRHGEAGLTPIGFLDDDRDKRGQTILGLPVLGPTTSIAEHVAAKKIDEVLIAIPSAPGSVVRKIVNQCREIGVRNRTIPGIFDLLNESVSISQLREVDLEDLLRREPARLAIDEIAGYIRGKSVLVTGAGGSIGSELVRQVMRFQPKNLILLGRGENSIYEIEREIKSRLQGATLRTVICDVRNREKLEVLFREEQPRVIFHAAAHKHVPLMEMNPDEAVLNNVGGTKNLVELALKFGVEQFVNISTDKAVNPTSVMGATKRIAEQVVLWGANQAGPGKSYVSVRFGNVLGSRGSVVPLFKEQIKKREPITITHPDMVRYFMTIPEATQLVLQAGGMKDQSAVFVLDMGEPVKIYDLAKDLIRLSGLVPEEDIEIVFTGLRPGEKLFEELLTSEETSIATKNSKIFSSKNRDDVDPVRFERDLAQLFTAAQGRDGLTIRNEIKRLVPSFKNTQ